MTKRWESGGPARKGGTRGLGPGANWQNRTLFQGENLEFMRAMNSGSVDLIATDPPFNKGRDFHATPDSLAAAAGGASFQDRWSWERDVHQEWVDKIKDDYPQLMEAIRSARLAHSDGMGAFMCFMAVRLMEMRRILKPEGSIYLHCDPTASHYLKAIMDAIFGWKNFRNEIVWCYHGPGSPKMRQFNRKHDLIFWYVKAEEWTFNRDEVRVPYKDPKQSLRRAMSPEGSFTAEEVAVQRAKGKVPEDWWEIRIAARSRKEATGYPTQKPLALYDRIIRASSNKGDIVLDPFAGCATTLVAAERLSRQWVGIDYWERAHKVVLDRLHKEGLAVPKKEKPDQFEFSDVSFVAKPPKRTDAGEPAAPFILTPLEFREPLQKWQMLTREQMAAELANAQSTAEGLVCCAGCGRELEAPFMELDHITPRAERGENDISNRILLCRPCNGRKSNILTLEGLIRENNRTGWMKNKPKAKRARSMAEHRYHELRDGRRNPGADALV